MEGFEFLEVEETTLEDEFDVDPQDDWGYDLYRRDEYRQYQNKYGDINYIKPDVSILGSRSILNLNNIYQFYKAQKARLGDGKYKASYPHENAKFHLDTKTEQLYAFTSKKKSS